MYRCLEKNPLDRYQSAIDLRHDLAGELEEIRSGRDLNTHAMMQPGWWRSPIVAALLGLAAGMGVLASAQLLMTAEPTAAMRLANPVQLTFGAGVEDNASWSPDGVRLAYESEEAGNWDIWVAQPGTGIPINLTADNSGTDRFPSWSPDGRQIAFVSTRSSGAGLYLMSALGGSPRKIVDAAIPDSSPRIPSWSADGAEVVINIGENAEEEVVVVSTSSGATRTISLPRAVPNWKVDVTRSPDSRFVAYAQGLFSSFLAEVSRLWIVPVDGEPIAISDGQSRDRRPTWSHDPHTLYFLSARGGAMDLWRQALAADGRPNRPPEQVSTGLGMRSFAFSADGTKVAFSRGREISNIWRVPIVTGRRVTWADAEPVTAEHAFIQYVDVSADGRRLIFGSDRTGNQDLWLLPVGGGLSVQLTTHPAPEDAPRWSNDARTIVFRCFRGGNQEICAIPTNGGPSEQLTQHPDEDTMPALSPDEQSLVFVSRRRGEHRDLWLISPRGSEPREIVQNANFPTYTPDGEWITYTSETDLRLWRVRSNGQGEPERLSERRAYLGRWAPDGRTFYYTARPDREGNIWAFSATDRSEYQVTELRGRRGTLGYGFATDGRYIYFTWWENTGDLWVMDVVRQ